MSADGPVWGLEEDTWTGQDGTERTTHKLVCNDIGASLRFATVEVTRTERRPGHDADDPGAGPPDGYDEEQL
ncbi:MAG: hypothetical protein M0020_05790 [Actinomycetota bacterium]|nr:hypothetical protein [Actinomycetota bacterium]